MTLSSDTVATFRKQRGWAIPMPGQPIAVTPAEDVRGLRVLAVHAHADDETTFSGGTTARAIAGGTEVAIITCTEDKGAVSTIFDPNWNPADTERLGEIRTDEWRQACAALGVKPENMHWLGYRDSGMAGSASSEHPEAFCNADLAEVTGRIVRTIRDFKPDVVIGYDDWGGYGHPDHIMAHKAMVRAVFAAGMPNRYPETGDVWEVQKMYYATFPQMASQHAIDTTVAAGLRSPLEGAHKQYFTSAAPDGWATTAVDARGVYHQKLQAMDAHRSQIPPDWPMRALPEPVARAAFGTEYYHLPYSRVETSLPEASIFAGIPRRQQVAARAAADHGTNTPPSGIS